MWSILLIWYMVINLLFIKAGDVTMDITNKRKMEHDIDSIYLQRWSPRAFSTKPVEREKLNAILEAARWAPSAANLQPWRFVIVEKNEDKERFLSFVNENNVAWCQHAPILAAIISKTIRNEEGAPNTTHAFDTGTAWGYLTLEAARQGLITHGMGGFDRKKAKEILQIPDEYDVQAITAIGYHDPNAELLPEKFKEREVPSNRIMIEDFVFEGKFNEKYDIK